MGYNHLEFLTDFEWYIGSILNIEVKDDDLIIKTDYERIDGNIVDMVSIIRGLNKELEDFAEDFKTAEKIGDKL